MKTIAFQVLGAVILGTAVAFLGGFAGASLLGADNTGWNDLIGSVLGMLVGAALGAIIGIYLVGRLLGRRGSLLGVVLGGAGGLVLSMVTVDPIRAAYERAFDVSAFPAELMLAYILGVVVVLAVLGFNWRALTGRRAA